MDSLPGFPHANAVLPQYGGALNFFYKTYEIQPTHSRTRQPRLDYINQFNPKNRMVSINLARIIAKISGDGHLSKRQIMYFNTSATLREEFKEDIKVIFGKTKMSEGVMSSGTPYIAVFGKHIVEVLNQFLPSYNSYDIFIPEVILKAEDKILREYMRTFYDDEGCASLRLNKKTNEWKRSITLTSNSYKILTQIKEALYSLGIETNSIIRTKAKSNYDHSFVLSITGKKNFLKFRRKVGFKHPQKARRVDQIIFSYNATSKNKYGFESLKREIKEKNELVVPENKGGQLTGIPAR